MPFLPYPQLPELLQRAHVEEFTSTVEFEPRGPVSANEIPNALSKAVAGWTLQPAIAGLFPTWAGRNRMLRLQPPHIVSNFKAEEKTLNPGIRRAFDQLVKHANQLHKQLAPLGNLRFVAFVVDVHFSALHPEPLPPPGVVPSAFLHVPNLSAAPLVDAEWRAAVSDGRYYTNWSLGTFEMREISARALVNQQTGVAMQSDVVSNVLKDSGLRLRVDVNSKVNQISGAGPIAVGPDDFVRLRDIGIPAIESGLSALKEMIK